MSHGRDDHGFAHSLTDLMAGVAVTFLLIAAIFMLQASRARAEATRRADDAKRQAAQAAVAEEKYINLKRSAQRSIDALRTLQERLKASQIETELDRDDPFLMRIIFQSETLFEPSECVPSKAAREHIGGQVFEAFRAVCESSFRSTFLHSIVLEGHTDRNPFSGGTERCGSVDHCESRDCSEEGFRNNVRLSAARAQEVFFEARRRFEATGGDATLVHECLDQYFAVVGRGPVEPRGGGTWTAPATAEELRRDRRVVLKVRAKSPSALSAEEQVGH